MPQRISHSLLDPYLTVPIKRLYASLPIPRSFPPEGIVLIGHTLAIAGALGLAFSTSFWWAGWIAALGIVGNHVADCLDGTHARATGQCRNGGELLDHFLDPLSFAYWLVGVAVSCGRLDLGLVAVICLFATAILTNIKAKLIGEFSLARFGPTEFKSLLAAYGLAMSLLLGQQWLIEPTTIVIYGFVALIVVGVLQLCLQLYQAVRQVNREGQPADTSEWVIAQN